MPRADRGSLALDILYMVGLDEETLARLRDIALRYRAIIVTAPSPVPVWGPAGPLRVVLGVGSIVYPIDARSELEALRLKLLELSAPEWVEGCVASEDRVLSAMFSTGSGELNGRLIPGDLRDPLALMLAGAMARAARPLQRSPPVASINGETVVWYGDDGVVSTVDKGTEAWQRLRLASLILGLCIKVFNK